eukprot:GFYU01006749.1.p1 GENE.GFYU01006749.1~~GFYU01006749.1.p1  ORF type:complete len:413 (-),score=89.87 GFYU01006749.1:96-1334(-)
MDKDEFIANFSAVTGQDVSVAERFYSSSGGNLQSAIDRFFEPESSQPAAPTSAVPAQSDRSHWRDDSYLDNWSDDEPANTRDSGNNDYDNNDNSGNVGPHRDAPVESDDPIQNIFNKAEKVNRPPADSGSAAPKPKIVPFQGQGRSLNDNTGGNNNDNNTPAQRQPRRDGPGARGGPGGSSNEDSEPEAKTVKVTFYANGFTVDDSNFKTNESPDGKKFLEVLNKGYVPPELHEYDQHGRPRPVSISLDDRRKDTYEPPPPPKYVAFSGSGQRLSHTDQGGDAGQSASALAGDGWSIPGLVGSAVGLAWSSASYVTGLLWGQQEKTFTVDESQPTMTIRIRLADGTQVSQKFNLTHTIEDVHTFCALRCPPHPDSVQRVMGGYPLRPLTDMEKTVEEMKLSGMSLTHEFTSK